MSATSLSLIYTSECVGNMVLMWVVRTIYGFSVCMGGVRLTMDKPLYIDPQGVIWAGKNVGLRRKVPQRCLSTLFSIIWTGKVFWNFFSVRKSWVVVTP
jgi:hypothetical protein